jgi:hypothetical protein
VRDIGDPLAAQEPIIAVWLRGVSHHGSIRGELESFDLELLAEKAPDGDSAGNRGSEKTGGTPRAVKMNSGWHLDV